MNLKVFVLLQVPDLLHPLFNHWHLKMQLIRCVLTACVRVGWSRTIRWAWRGSRVSIPMGSPWHCAPHTFSPLEPLPMLIPVHPEAYEMDYLPSQISLLIRNSALLLWGCREKLHLSFELLSTACKVERKALSPYRQKNPSLLCLIGYLVVMRFVEGSMKII